MKAALNSKALELTVSHTQQPQTPHEFRLTSIVTVRNWPDASKELERAYGDGNERFRPPLRMIR